MTKPRRRKPIKVDESVEREPVTVDQFTGFIRELLQAGPPKDVKSENREPTKAERERRSKFQWR